jgi:hypothetical protein
VVGKCAAVTEKLPNLAFHLGEGENSRWMTLKAANYFVEHPLNDTSDAVSCHLGVIGGQNDTTGWILGSLFMQSYYVVFDAEAEQPRVGLYIAKNETTLGATIDNVDSQNYLIMFIISTLGIVIFIGYAFIGVQLQKLNKKNKQERDWEE